MQGIITEKSPSGENILKTVLYVLILFILRRHNCVSFLRVTSWATAYEIELSNSGT